MYLATSRSADAAANVVRAPLGSRVPGNVIALGTVSLVTDISSEMVTSCWPVPRLV